MTIPQEVVDAFTKVMDFEISFPATSGWYDRPHGANIKLGKGWAKVHRLIAGHALDTKKVLPILACSYKSPAERIAAERYPCANKCGREKSYLRLDDLCHECGKKQPKSWLADE